MKLKKYEFAVLAVTLTCVVFTAGFFLGRQSAQTHVVIQADGAAVSSDAGQQENEQDEEELTPEENVPVETSDQQSQVQTDDRLDLNEATAAQFEMLPGIGPVLAERIVDYRESHGQFTSTEEIMEVSGIGDKTYEAICDLITVDGQAGGVK